MTRHILSLLLLLLSAHKSLTTPLPEDTTGILQVLTSQYPLQTTPRPVTGVQSPVTGSAPTSPLFNLLESTYPWLNWSTRAQNNPSTPYYGSTYPYWPTGTKNNPSTPYYGSTYPYWPTGAKNNPSTPFYGSTYPYWATGTKNNPSIPYYGSTYPYWLTGANNNPSTPYYGSTYPYWPTGATKNNPATPYYGSTYPYWPTGATKNNPATPYYGSTYPYWPTGATKNNPATPYYGSTYPYWPTGATKNNPSTPYYGSTYPYWPTGTKNNPSTPYYGSTYPYWPTGATKNNPSTPYYGSTYPYWPTSATNNNPSTPYYGSTYPYWLTGTKNNPSTPYYGSTYPYWATGATNNPSYPYQPTGSGNEPTTHAYPQTTSNPLYSTPSRAWIQPSTVKDPFYHYTTYPYWLTGVHASPTPASYVTGSPYWETSRQYSSLGSLGDTSRYPPTPLFGTGDPHVTFQPELAPTTAPRTLTTLYDTWEMTHPQLAGLLHLTVSSLAGGGDSPTVNCTLDALPRNTVGIVSLVISKYSGQPIPRYAEVASINIFHPDSPKLGPDFQSAAVKGVLNNDSGTFYLSVQSSLASVADARWFVCVADVLNDFGVSQDIRTSATI